MDIPCFLVALPQMMDPVFGRAVVLLMEHGSGGSFGLIINKPVVDEENSLAQMIAEVKDASGATLLHYQEDVFEGGPVNEQGLYALHAVPELGIEENKLGEGLYFSTDPDVFQKLLENDDFGDKRRFFLGSAQWIAGQLESELRSGSWVMVSYDKKFLFESISSLRSSVESSIEAGESWQESLWKRVLTHGGLNPLTLLSPGNSDSGYN